MKILWGSPPPTLSGPFISVHVYDKVLNTDEYLATQFMVKPDKIN